VSRISAAAGARACVGTDRLRVGQDVVSSGRRISDVAGYSDCIDGVVGRHVPVMSVEVPGRRTPRGASSSTPHRKRRHMATWAARVNRSSAGCGDSVGTRWETGACDAP